MLRKHKIVTITPLALEKDSRAYKQAKSVGEIGCQSIVVEGQSSDPNWHCQNIERISLGGVAPSGVNKRSTPVRRRQWLKYFGLYNLCRFFVYLFRYSNRYFFSIIRQLPKADVYYLHGFYHYPAVLVRQMISGGKYIYDAHDYYSDMHADLDSFQRNWIGAFEKFVERKCVKNASEFVTVSSGLAELYEKNFNRLPLVIRNVQERADVRTRGKVLSIPGADFVYVCVGNMKRGNGVKNLIEAVERSSNNAHLAFVGSGYDELAVEYESMQRIHFLPPVPPDHVVSFIRSADAGVVLYTADSPNLLHCLPNRFLHYVAAGIPILYPDLPELRKIGNAYDLGVVIDPSDQPDLSRVISEFSQNPQRLKQFKNESAKAGTELCWETEQKKLFAVLNKVVEANAA